MTYEEAMKVMDEGGKVCLESDWVMRMSGFAWGTWYQRTRQWTKEDSARDEARTLKGDWDAPPIESSGPYCRSLNTLCETVLYPDIEGWEEDVPERWKTATDWVDVTDRFDGGVPKGYREYFYPAKKDASHDTD